ncbi:membrane-bound metallopeptidase putative [Acetobacter sp. CAG:977]|nr:membrane-bound metallopeptidase putative [Acetobacter sp. CAG:977]
MGFKKTAALFCLVFITGQALPSFSFAAIDSSVEAKSELSKVTRQIRAAESEHKKLREKARAVQKEILDVRRKMVSAASSIQEQEESLGRLEEKLKEFEDQQAFMKNRLEVRKMQRVKVLAALQNLAWKPTEALLAQPLEPQDTLRSALLLREAVPRLEYSTEGLRKDLTKIASLTTAIRAQYAQIKTMAKRLESKRRNMNALIQKKTKLQSTFASESTRAKEKASSLARQASDLKDLLARLDAESARQRKLHNTMGIPTGAFMAARGNIPFPVKGNIIKKFGEMTDSGLSSKGITIKTRPNAQVISPYDGTVLFAGPFRGYGELLIIEHGDGYHTLLAGIGRLDTSVGQSLLAGEPVGIMVADSNPSLYIEIRKNGQPVNPSTWLTNKKG